MTQPTAGPTRPSSPADDLPVLAAATERLLATSRDLDDDAARARSLLPGWSVGHVLTHVARNADGMVNLVTWALTGVPTPMYPSAQARADDIEAGSGRPAAELARDVAESAARLDAALQALVAAGPDAWDTLLIFGATRPGQVPDSPAVLLGYHRSREVEIHHVDLGLPRYRPADWPPAFVARTSGWLDDRTGPTDVTGDPAEVLAWRLGRGAGPSVARPDGSAPGEPPAW